MPIKFLTLIFFIFLFAGCDPMRRVIVKNTSSSPVTITWKLKEDSARHSPLFIFSNSDKVTFTIGNKPGQNIMRLPFGMGNWKDGALDAMVDDLKSFEIESNSADTLYKEEGEIKAYLQSHLKGILKKNIKIYIQ